MINFFWVFSICFSAFSWRAAFLYSCFHDASNCIPWSQCPVASCYVFCNKLDTAKLAVIHTGLRCLPSLPSRVTPIFQGHPGDYLISLFKQRFFLSFTKWEIQKERALKNIHLTNLPQWRCFFVLCVTLLGGEKVGSALSIFWTFTCVLIIFVLGVGGSKYYWIRPFGTLKSYFPTS